MNECGVVGQASNLSSSAGFQPAVAHVPEDMTATVAADVTLDDLQAALTKAGQWLPLDPPNPTLTLREILDRNESGPRRFGYGTARDYVIGLKVRLADGRVVKSGGQVVKNVAGYDLQKLFIGAGGTLGTIQEVTFKLRPKPECERFVERVWDSPTLLHFAKCDQAAEALEAAVASELQPVVMDLHSVPERGLQPASTSVRNSMPNRPEVRAPLTMVLGFDGSTEDVEWQLALAAKLGFTQPSTLDYDKTLCADCESPRKVSVLPSKLIETLRDLGEVSFVARAGNGIIFHRAASGEDLRPSPLATRQLERRLKDAFDPKRLLPDLPA